MIRNSIVKIALVMIVAVGLGFSPVLAQGPSVEAWRPAFDPSGAKYRAVISNVSRPILDGAAGFQTRDELWKRTDGQIFIDYKPFSMLGGFAAGEGNFRQP